jgi:hypothetical protein
VNRPQDLITLLQAVQHILLHERKLDIAGQLLQLRELAVCFGEQGLLVFLAPQG